MKLDITVVSKAVVFFSKKKTNSYYNSYTWPKTLHWYLSKVIPFGAYNCNFEAINYSRS